jgi:hypothetical protein
VPVVPSCILDPFRTQFLTLLPERVVVHPLGCHRRRIADTVVFDKLIEVLVFGAGYERIGDATCSATTLRRRRDEWIGLGIMEQLRLIALEAYDRMIGLDLDHLPLDGCITKAPAGGECAGPSPVDRAKDGTKRSQVTDGYGIPLGTVTAPANRTDHTLLDATLATLTLIGPLPEHVRLHLDAGYDNNPARQVIDTHARTLGLTAEISPKGVKTPIQHTRRWPIERTNSWCNNFGKIRRNTERRHACIDFYLAAACILITIRSLIVRAWKQYRWDTRPRSPRIR